MAAQRMELVGIERFRYFVPTTICAYLAGICLLLIITSAFLAPGPGALAVTAAGIFGLALTGGLGAAFWHAQRRDLEYTRLVTTADAAANFAAVRTAAESAGWRIVCAEPGLRLVAQASASVFAAGERVAVRFRQTEVWVACICDPSVGFSLVGRRHCVLHRDLLRRAVAAHAP